MSVSRRAPAELERADASCARNAEQSQEKLRAGDYARQEGGKVVALTMPMNFGVRL